MRPFGQAESEGAEKFVHVAKVYEDHPMALHRCAMKMLFEAKKKKEAMVVVPSKAVEAIGFGDQFGLASMMRKDVV